MIELLASLTDWLHPETIVQTGGFWLLLLIIFLETGIFFGFFLPGDSLLLTAGLLCGTVYLDVSLYQLTIGLTVAGFLGAVVGYGFGKKTGSHLFTMKESLFFKRKYLIIAQDYYTRYGHAAFVIGRFLPFVRTFIPILAGVVNANLPKFLWFNILGTTIWISLFVVGGYGLKYIFPGIIEYLEFIILFLVMVTSTPLILAWIKQKRKNSKIKSTL